MEENDVVKALAALAQQSRLRLFRALVVAGPAGLTPSVLAEQLGVPGATLSFHLKELTHARLISQEREGRHLIYRASFDRMNALLGYLTANCCQSQPCGQEAQARSGTGLPRCGPAAEAAHSSDACVASAFPEPRASAARDADLP